MGSCPSSLSSRGARIGGRGLRARPSSRKTDRGQLEVLAFTWVGLLSFQTVKEMLENPSEPVSDQSYFDCIEGVMENSKVALPNSPPEKSIRVDIVQLRGGVGGEEGNWREAPGVALSRNG